MILNRIVFARRATVMGFAGVLIAGAIGCGTAKRDEPTTPPLTLRPSAIASGAQTFAEHCYQCHPGGAAGIGPALNNKPLPGWAMKFQVRHGLGTMPGFSQQQIADDELDDLVAYLKALRGLEPIQ